MSVSKFDTLPFNCYELGHTWSPYCEYAAAYVGYHCFKESLKIYGSCYLVSRLVTKRIPRNWKDVYSFFKDVIRSSIFLSMNGSGFVTVFCWLQKLFGSVNFYSTVFIPSLFATYAAILVEKPTRRPLLALYVLNVASETVYRMLRARGLVPNIKHFDLLLFTLSATTMLYRMKNGRRGNDVIDSFFTKIMGREEFMAPPRVSESGSVQNKGKIEENGANLNILIHFNSWTKQLKIIFHKMTSMIRGQCHQSGQKCAYPHKNSCFQYWLRGFWTRFSSGFGLQATLQLILQIQNYLQSNSTQIPFKFPFMRIIKSCLKTGFGLSLMCFTFRLLNCWSRWVNDSPSNSILAPLMSTSLGFYILGPPSTVALYLFFKTAESVISDSHKSNNWKIIRWVDSLVYGGGWSLLYAICTAILFHTAIMEPHNLKPSYSKYLSRVTGGKMHEINRHLLSVYGTKSNTLGLEFWPNYNAKYLSEPMKELIQRREDFGMDNKFMRELTMPFLNWKK